MASTNVRITGDIVRSQSPNATLMTKGTLASLHAKCAVADGERLLVSSANLTEFALTVNVELGLLVEGDDAPGRVQQHLESLLEVGALKRVT